MGACYARAHPRPAPASRRCNIPCSPKSTAWLLHFSVLCVVASLGDTFYWSTYHAYFAALGNHDTRGAEIGVPEAIAAVVGIASPLATGWALSRSGLASCSA